MEFEMSIGARIKNLRTRKKWTQGELGEKIGLGFGAVSSFENEKNNPSIEVVEKLSVLFGVTTDYLITGREEPATISNDEQEVIKLYREDNQMREALKAAIDFKKKAINYLSHYQQQHAHAA